MSGSINGSINYAVPDAPDGPSLRHTLTTPKIVFLVVAAAAPMAGVVGSVPLAFALGNGVGVPATFVLAGVVLLCFSVGYAAMSRRIVNTGGFYSYISHGLGRTPAVAAGLVAVVAYNAAVIGVAGALGYFADLVATSHGLRLHWTIWAALAVIVVAYLGYRRIDLSVRLLAVLMIAEVAVLVLLGAAIVVSRGTAALPAVAASPASLFAPGLGVALMFALISYVGFEAAALFGEETRNPRRSVPLATYMSVVLITVFFALVSWTAVGGIGADRLAGAASTELGDLFFNLAGRYLNGAVTAVMQILLCTSLFGAMLGLHNAANRYLFVLGRERVLPGWLGAVHPRFHAPHRASVAQTAATVVVCAVFALAGLHPYTNLATTMLGLGTVGIVALQAAVTVSVMAFFRGRPEWHWWRTCVAPMLALIGLGAALVLLLVNFPLVTGTDSALVNQLPWLMVLAVCVGVGYGWWLKTRQPERYASLGGRGDRVTADAVMTTSTV
jgi:amino acid transporter